MKLVKKSKSSSIVELIDFYTKQNSLWFYKADDSIEQLTKPSDTFLEICIHCTDTWVSITLIAAVLYLQPEFEVGTFSTS